jgi:hypothetical protein
MERIEEEEGYKVIEKGIESKDISRAGGEESSVQIGCSPGDMERDPEEGGNVEKT